MLGVPFTGTDNDAQGAKLEDIISGDFVGVDYDDDNNWLVTSTQLQVWVPGSGYTVYYYQTDPKGEGDTDVSGWVDGGANYVGGTRVKPGSAMWFLSPSAAESESIVFAGQVLDTAKPYTVPTAATGFTMVANPWPVDVSINSTKLVWNNITAVDYDDNNEWLVTSPQVQIWDAVSGYTVLYYQTDAEGTGDTDNWGWVDGTANYVGDDVVLKAGHAMWFLAGTNDTGAGSITFAF